MFHSLVKTRSAVAPDALRADAPGAYPATYQPGGFTRPLPQPYVLNVTGLVAQPQAFTLKDLAELGDGVYEGRLVSADGWSYHSRWDAVLLKRLIDRVQPLPEAQYLNQTDLQGRTEWLALSHVRNSNALLCTGERGQPLAPLYGGPLSLMLFDRYSYKGLGQLATLDFAATPAENPEGQRRGHAAEGRIVPGDYYAFDQKASRRVG